MSIEKNRQLLKEFSLNSAVVINLELMEENTPSTPSP